MENYNPIYLTIGQHPRDILKFMDQLLVEQTALTNQHKRRRWLPLLLFLLAFPFCLLDLVLDYSSIVFILVAVFLVVAAIFLFVIVLINRPNKRPFAPQYQLVQSLIHTLRDDVPKTGSFLGHLDLTGAEKPEKLLRSGNNALGQVLEFYHDEWFKLKAKLYDGNILRLSLIERRRVRKGFYKRSLSGKNKWKPAKMKNHQELKVRVAVNPQLYAIVPTSEARVGTVVGAYTIEKIDASNGMVAISAIAGTNTVQSGDVLGVLHLMYRQLQRRGDQHG